MSEADEFRPLELTDEVMVELFNRISKNDNYRPYKAEIDAFFQSRIWSIIEQEASVYWAHLFQKLLNATREDRPEIVASIRVMAWWMNLEDTLFRARERATSLNAETVGGESWQDRP